MQAAEREMLYRFFALPAAAAHESWLTFMPAEIVSLSRRSQLGTLLLSRMLMRRASLPAPQSFELAEEHRWVLQSPLILAQAAMRIGAVSLGPQVAASIERERVLLLRSALGPELYRESVAAAAAPFAVIAREPLGARLDAPVLGQALVGSVRRGAHVARDRRVGAGGKV